MALHRRRDGKEGGIALFMVIGAMTVLSLIVTEFTYVAQVNARMAFDGLDQVKAHYLAKSGLKISLLRLKAYQNVKAIAGGKEGSAMLPKGLLEKIWNFPFFYPIPTDLPGMTTADKDRIQTFTKDSKFEGRFSAAIESESGKYNLNLLLSPFAPPSPSSSPSPVAGSPPPSQGPDETSPNPKANPSPGAPAQFSAEAAQKSLADYLGAILESKFQSDEAFANEYRDFKLGDLMDNLISWADHTYERRGGSTSQLPPKGAPFYTLSELHQIEPMDDRLYELFSSNLTVSTTPGINVNTMNEATLKALVPGISEEEVKDFFKFRDSPDEDNLFKKDEDFFKYLQLNVSVLSSTPQSLEEFKTGLTKRGVRIVTDETQFKITVQAVVKKATRLIEAWVTLLDPSSQGSGQNKDSAPGGPGASNPVENESPRASSGLKITYMRIL